MLECEYCRDESKKKLRVFAILLCKGKIVTKKLSVCKGCEEYIVEHNSKGEPVPAIED